MPGRPGAETPSARRGGALIDSRPMASETLPPLTAGDAALPLRLTRLARLHRSGRGIEDVTLEARAGEIVGLLGARGSGRTTLLRLIAGELQPRAGRIELWGASEARARRAARPRIGFQRRRDAHFEALSGFANAYHFGNLHGYPRERLAIRIDALFDELELRALRDLPVARWDPDARRRLSLAEALVHEPALLLLDEPLAGMSYSSEVAARHVIARTAGRGAAVVMATRSAELAGSVCGRIAFLSRGRIFAQGIKSELLEGLSGRAQVACELEAPVDPASLRALAGVESVAASGHRLTVISRRADHALDAIVAELDRLGARLLHLDVKEADLGDAYSLSTGVRLEEQS